jgi:HSP20 family molecular chaperone IbpA
MFTQKTTTFSTKIMNGLERTMEKIAETIDSVSDVFDNWEDEEEVEEEVEETSSNKDVKIDKGETSDIIRIALPGIKKENISIQLKEQTLTVKVTCTEDDLFPVWSRAYTFRFTRADETKITSTLKDGILTIVVGKKGKTETEATKIKID